MALMLVWQFYARHLSAHARAAHAFLREMPADQIQAVKIEPYAVMSLSDHTITIRDRDKIQQLATAMRTASGVAANHPEARWVAILRFQLKNGKEYGGQIEDTHNQGTLFLYASQVNSGWNYGAYRQDSLGPLLESWVKAGS